MAVRTVNLIGLYETAGIICVSYDIKTGNYNSYFNTYLKNIKVLLKYKKKHTWYSINMKITYTLWR